MTNDAAAPLGDAKRRSFVKGWQVFNLDFDNDVDLRDVASFQNRFGTGMRPHAAETFIGPQF